MKIIGAGRVLILALLFLVLKAQPGDAENIDLFESGRIRKTEVAIVVYNDGPPISIVRIFIDDQFSEWQECFESLELTDSLGNVYVFGLEEFNRSGEDRCLVKELPFALPPGELHLSARGNGCDSLVALEDRSALSEGALPIEGRFRGTTDQAYDITLDVNGNWVNFSYEFKLYGSGCTVTVSTNGGCPLSGSSFSCSWGIPGESSDVLAGSYDSQNDSWSGTWSSNRLKNCLASGDGAWDAAAVAFITVDPPEYGYLKEIDSFPSPGTYPTGLAFDGTDLWSADYTQEKIYQLDTAGTEISSFSAPYYGPQGLAFDGENLWNADSIGDKLYQFDSTGAPLSSFDSPGSSPTGLTWDGSYLWNADSRMDKIYQLDTAGMVISSFNTPDTNPQGLAFDGTDLWLADSTADRIFKLDVSGKILKTFFSPGAYPTGLAFDGSYLWNADQYDNKIYKLKEIPGLTYVGFPLDQEFSVTNKGSADLVIGALELTGAAAGDFAIIKDNCSGQTLGIFDGCAFTLNTVPEAQGRRLAAIQIPSNDPDNPNYAVELDVLAEICSTERVRILRNPAAYFSDLAGAMDAAFDGETIQAQGRDCGSNLLFDRPIALTVAGGYGCTYSPYPHTTQIKGGLTIEDGSLTVKGIELID